jgi:DNA-binding transcriptional LysR family regulator
MPHGRVQTLIKRSTRNICGWAVGTYEAKVSVFVGYSFGFHFRVTLKQQTGIESRKHFDVLIGGALAQADDMKDIFALRLFTRVARLGNFSAAARECGLSQSHASRIVADLETDLGTRLLSRSTRAVVPTEAGAEFLARIESILGALDEAEHSVRGGADLRGLLRMSTPTSFGIRTVIPRLAAFIEKHPDLHIHFLLEDRQRDLVRDAVDVAIRLGRLADSSATAKRLRRFPGSSSRHRSISSVPVCQRHQCTSRNIELSPAPPRPCPRRGPSNAAQTR